MSKDDPKSIDKLVILKKGQQAGALERTKEGVRFVYDQDYLDDKDSSDLSFHLSKKRKVYELKGDNLPPYFAGLLPEGKRFKALVKTLKTSEDDLFTLFAAIGHNTTGDVKIGNIQEVENKIREPFSEINFYDYFFQYIESDVKRTKNDFAFAGVQDKISASMLTIPLNIAKKNKAYILKLNSKDKQNLVENEHAVMELARKCGLTTAKTKIIYDKDKNSGLLVERFDTFMGESVHVEDGCQILNRYPADKYRLHLRDLADAIYKISQTSQVQIINLLKLYCFSYLVGNGDLHAKNISLLEHNRDFILSPCYDLLSTYPYGDSKMAIKINGRDDNIKLRDFFIFGGIYHIPEAVLEKVIGSVVTKFKKYYSVCLNQIPFSGKEKNLFLSCVEKRVSHLS